MAGSADGLNDPLLEGREFRLKTTLGDGYTDMYLLSATVEESLGEPFTINVEGLSNKFDLDPKDLLGKAMTIEMDLPDPKMGEGGKRFFHALVDSVTYNDRSFGFAHYSFSLKPWLWMLRYRTDCRIYQEVTVPDLIKSIFRDEFGYDDIEDKLTGSYPAMEYCVQYRESYFNFVSRMMEQVGIYYFFKHEKEKHTIVLIDDVASHEEFKGFEKIDYFPQEADYKRDQEYIDHWTFTQQIRPGKYAIDDYNFKTPSADLESRHSLPGSHAKDDGEVFDYPGEIIDTDEGTFFVTRRMEEQRQQYERRYGRGNARGLACGHKFELKQFEDRTDQSDKKYLIVTASHSIKVETEWETKSGGGEDMYSCSFQALIDEMPFRPLRKTPKPLIPGPQTAVVTGPEDEEIYTDEYGRVKVIFHWDRYAKDVDPDKTTCFIRVAQIWAGKGWGAMFIPRIEQEVIVEFLEGDPDRPIITGRVYNEEQKVPYELPDTQVEPDPPPADVQAAQGGGGEGKNISTIKSESTKEGQDHYNEIRFDDTKDAEQFYIRAEKDFDGVIGNNETRRVGFDDNEPGDQSIDVKNKRTVTVHDDNDDKIVKTKDRTATIEKGNDEITVSMGDRTVDISAGQETHTAATKITLKVGASSIVLEPAKITISSTQIDIKATAALNAEGLNTTVKGTATLILSGGLVKIN